MNIVERIRELQRQQSQEKQAAAVADRWYTEEQRRRKLLEEERKAAAEVKRLEGNERLLADRGIRTYLQEIYSDLKGKVPKRFLFTRTLEPFALLVWGKSFNVSIPRGQIGGLNNRLMIRPEWKISNPGSKIDCRYLVVWFDYNKMLINQREIPDKDWRQDKNIIVEHIANLFVSSSLARINERGSWPHTIDSPWDCYPPPPLNLNW